MIRPQCSCGNLCEKRYGRQKGEFRTVCNSCRKRRNNRPLSHENYTKHKKLICERCGFIPEHKSQLDVHHKDEDHSNHNIINLETLCANCHRLHHFG